MLGLVCLWFVPQIALAVPPGARVELGDAEPDGWLRGQLLLECGVELHVSVHRGGQALRLERLVFLDPRSEDPEVAELAASWVHYPLAAARPALEGLARQARELESARLRPASVSLTVGEPGASPPWFLGTWRFEEDLGRRDVQGSVSGRVELARELRLAPCAPPGDEPRARGGNPFIGPFSTERDFDDGLADAILLLDELQLPVPGFLLANEGGHSGSFQVFGALAGSRGEQDGLRFHAAAHVRNDRSFVVAYEGGGELSTAGFAAMLAWAWERQVEGELLAALAPISRGLGPDRALAVTVHGDNLWTAESGYVRELCYAGGELRVARTLSLDEGGNHSGNSSLCWAARSDAGWLYVHGNRARWYCSYDQRPPFPALELEGEKHTLVAGVALVAR